MRGGQIGGFYFFGFRFVGDFGWEGVAPAAVAGDGVVDGGKDLGEDFGVGPERVLDGVIDDGPDFYFVGGVGGVGRDEDDFVVFGESGEALFLFGFALGFSLGGVLGRGKLDPVEVEGKVGDGELFVVEVDFLVISHGDL